MSSVLHNNISRSHRSDCPPVMSLIYRHFWLALKASPGKPHQTMRGAFSCEGPFPVPQLWVAKVQVLHVSTDLGNSLGTQGCHFQDTYDSWMSKSAPGCVRRDQSSKWVGLIPQREAHLERAYETSPEAPETFAGVVPSTAGCSNLIQGKTSTLAALRLSDKKRIDISNPGNTEFIGLFPIPSTKFETSGFVFAVSTTLSGYGVLYCSQVLPVQGPRWTGAGWWWAEQ